MASTADDFAIALQLQEQFDRENDTVAILNDDSDPGFGRYLDHENATSHVSARNTGSSLCDETWELVDPSPDAWALFVEFNKKYFWGKLTGVELRWSSRMTL